MQREELRLNREVNLDIEYWHRNDFCDADILDNIIEDHGLTRAEAVQMLVSFKTKVGTRDNLEEII